MSQPSAPSHPAAAQQCQSLLLEAQRHAGQGHVSNAIKQLTQLLAIDPEHAEAWFGLAALNMGQGHMTDAMHGFRKARELRPDDPVIAYNLAITLQALGNENEAEHCYRAAVTLKPDFALARVNLGNILQRSGRLDEAMDHYRDALAAEPRLAEAHYNIGLILRKRSQLDEAERALRDALQIKPDHGLALFTLGAIYQERQLYEQAIPWYRKAIAVNPGHVEAHSNLGLIYQHMGQHQAAVEQIHHAITICTRDNLKAETKTFADQALDALYFNLGHLFKQQRNFEAWHTNFNAFSKHTQHSIYFHQYAYEIAFMTGQFDAEQQHLRHLVEHDYSEAEFEQLHQVLSEIQYVDVAQAEIYRLYKQFNELLHSATLNTRLAGDRKPVKEDRLRIGYLSPDFKQHVMGVLMADILSRHDRQRFEIQAYSLVTEEDGHTEHLAGLCDRFVRLTGMSPLKAAQTISSNEIDILVDLAGLTEGSQPHLLAYKPAPIQITHLGYHGSTGIDAVDFKLTDAHADRPENACFMMEKLLAMEGCVMPFHHEDAAPTGPTRAELSIPEDAVVFGEFVNIKKLSRRCLGTWRSVLERVNKAILLFSPLRTSDREPILLRLAAAGIDASRVRFLTALGDPGYARARYRLVDMVLDTFPYSGGDTTMSALDMSVPVITLSGERQSERMTYSILKHLGLNDCIATDEEDFVEHVCRLAHDPGRLQAITDSIAARLQSSGMSDPLLYTRRLEAAYLAAVEQFGGPAQ